MDCTLAGNNLWLNKDIFTAHENYINAAYAIFFIVIP